MKKLTLLKKTFIVLALLATFAILVVFGFLRSSLPPVDGKLNLKNLSQSVRIVRDDHGIPHIYAANRLDSFRALGFVMASERLFQMELSRRMTQGQLSEIFGEAALSSDKLYRSLALRRASERMIAFEKQNSLFDQALWQELEAFCDGINQYIQSRPLPYEFTLLRFKPRPFEPLDAYILTGHMAYSFGIALKADPLMTELAKTLPGNLFQELRNDRLTQPLKIAGGTFVDLSPLQLLAEGAFYPFFEGSNAWLVAPHRSESGKSLFANDPHIGYSSPSVWFEAHIKSPEFELYGHHLSLIPYGILGHSRHHAWGFTMSMGDDMDLYRETLDRGKKTVLFRNKWQPYQEWQEVIKVKGHADVVLTLIETPHGPLMDEVLSEKGLALKWAYHRSENNPMKSLRGMGAATDIKSFEEALKFATAPGLNVMYADADNIAWWMVGDLAIKANPHSDLILDGASGKDEYQGVVPWSEKPHAVNPKSGIIVTANSRPVGLTPTMRGDWQSQDRYQTISHKLSKKDKWSAEEMKALQVENSNSKTSVLLDKLLRSLKLSVKEQNQFSYALEVLKSWDHHSEIDSQAAAIYHTWNQQNIRIILEDLPPEAREAYLRTHYSWDFYERVLLNDRSSWWGNRDLADVISEGFRKALASLGSPLPSWGEIHTIEFTHPLGRAKPLNRIFNLGPYPMPGALHEINNNKGRYFGGDFKVVAGPSTRRVIDFSDPETSWGINPIGISGHLLSRFHHDQVQLFIRGIHRKQWMKDQDIERVKTHELTLEP